MLSEWINQKYLKQANINSIRKSFIKGKPYPNFALADFLMKEKALLLEKNVLKEQFTKQDKDLFSFSNTKGLLHSSNQIVGEFFSFLSSKELLKYMAYLTNEEKFNGIDMHAHKFVQGDYLLFHDDVVEGRGVAYILYLSHGFKEADGGRLRLYDIKKPQKPVKSVLPLFNSFACFKVSNKSLHNVEEVKTGKVRLTVGGWFYGDNFKVHDGH